MRQIAKYYFLVYSTFQPSARSILRFDKTVRGENHPQMLNTYTRLENEIFQKLCSFNKSGPSS